MSLLLNVTGRYSSERLRQLTNPDARGLTTNDATRLDFACADAQAEFKRRCAVDYDDTNPNHVDVCVELVVLKLMKRGSAPTDAVEKQQAAVNDMLTDVARVTGRDRPDASSSGSPLTLSEEVPAGSTVYPKFDPINLQGWRARGAGGR